MGRRVGWVGFLVLLLAGPGLSQEVAPTGLRVGESLPSVEGIDLNGKPVSISDFLGRGAVVLSFWSIHCSDCIRELDDLRSIRREFPPDQVSVVAVNTDSGVPLARLRGFLRRYETTRGSLGVDHLADRNAAVLDALGIRLIPLLVVLDASGRIASIHTGYAPEDRYRVTEALEQGRVALGAWSEGVRGRVRTVLRGSGPTGKPIEWGSFRVEEGVPLFGLYDGRGWVADAVGRPDRETEAARIERVAEDRIKVALLREALASVGVRLAPPRTSVLGEGGLRVPESPLVDGGRWRRLTDDLDFTRLYREQGRTASWVGDRYWVGLVGDVDLGGMRHELEKLEIPERSRRIRVQGVSDFDFKVRTVVERLRRRSYRLRLVEGEYLDYYGSDAQLVAEIQTLDLPFQLYVESPEPGVVRVEVL